MGSSVLLRSSSSAKHLCFALFLVLDAVTPAYSFLSCIQSPLFALSDNSARPLVQSTVLRSLTSKYCFPRDSLHLRRKRTAQVSMSTSAVDSVPEVTFHLLTIVVRIQYVMSGTEIRCRNQVVVYSSLGCKYCSIAKQTLRQQGVPFREISVGDAADARKEMSAKAGGATRSTFLLTRVLFHARY